MKKFACAVAVAAALTFSVMPAMAEEEAAPAPAEAMDAAAAPASAPAAAPAEPETPPETVVATVNGKEITYGLLSRVMKQVGGMPGASITPEMKKDVLDKLVDLDLVAQEAVKAGVDKDPDFVAGLEMYKNQQLYGIYLNKVIVETVKLGPDDAQNDYDANKDKYVTGEEVTASHILVNTEDEAKKVEERLAAGEDFAEIAKAESKCPSASRGGDLGNFGRGAMVPEFENAAFSLKVGETSAPVKTQYGWHIIKVTSKNSGGVKPFDKVKAEIEQQLLEKKQLAAYDELIAKLRKDGNVTINETALGVK